MTPKRSVPLAALLNDYFQHHPAEAARHLERLDGADAARVLADQPPARAAAVAEHLRLESAAEVLAHATSDAAKALLHTMDPGRSAPALARLDEARREDLLAAANPAAAAELRSLLVYPNDSAGHWMTPHVLTFRPDTTTEDALRMLRRHRLQPLRQVFLVDDEGRPTSAVAVHDLALADENTPLEELAGPLPPVVQATAPRAEIIDVLESSGALSLPVVDHPGRLIGVIRTQGLVGAAQAEASVDMQTMVGAGKDERALSGPIFAIRKRLPWLQINLLTAFLASFVVGLFEATIAQVTALAVLLPVVAGQSGNTGAQALAVTMRGLALREIRVRHWWRIARKELVAGSANGIAVAAVTSGAVWIWSGSAPLAGVIGSAMVVSMTVAGLAGATIPMVLTIAGQDPAQSSSIILTTVTDVVGFLTFLGLATLAAGAL